MSGTKPTKPTTRSRVLRWRKGAASEQVDDELAEEEPLEIQVDTRSLVVTMRTPGHDQELAAGFLVSEGLIHQRRDILKMAPYARNEQGNVLQVFLAPGVEINFGRLVRHVFASASCGLCGKAAIRDVHRHFPKVRSRLKVSAEILARLPAALRREQSIFTRTGGLHAAGLFNSRGRLLAVREDIGRHNAVDKLLGFALLADLLPLDSHVLMVSGRASFEILQKALAARIAVIAAVSAPSSLAVQFAKESRQTLVGFLREDRMNIYSRPERVGFGVKR